MADREVMPPCVRSLPQAPGRKPSGQGERRPRAEMIRVLTLRLYERHLDTPPARAPPAGIEIEMWDSPAAAGPVGTRWHPEAAQRFSEGQVCAVARAGADVVAYCWLTAAPVSVVEIDRTARPRPRRGVLLRCLHVAGLAGAGTLHGAAPAAPAVRPRQGPTPGPHLRARGQRAIVAGHRAGGVHHVPDRDQASRCWAWRTCGSAAPGRALAGQPGARPLTDP